MTHQPVPPLPGGVGVSHLRVYDSVAPDGLRGGTPHLHTACTEAYWVVRGEGLVQTLTAEGSGETPLTPGALVWFTPGTVHRLVNLSGDLEILVVMGNAGLPEAGDMVITFSPDVVGDPDRYRARATLPEHDATTAGSPDAANERRDAAVEAFLALREATEAGDTGPFEQFLTAAVALVSPRVDGWRRRWERGPVAAVDATARHLDALTRFDPAPLCDASVHQLPPPPDERRMGCCGTLGTYIVHEPETVDDPRSDP